MQTKSILAVALLSAATLVAGADTTTDTTTTKTVIKTITTTTPLSPSQSSKIDSGLNSYISSLTRQSEWTSVESVLHTAVPSSDLAALDTVYNPSITTAPWYSALPSAEKSYISSVIKAEASIMSKGGAAAQPTGLVMAAGAAAAGVLGIAAML